MIKRVLFSLLVLFVYGGAWGQLNVSFTTNPPAVNGVVNICLGQKVIFTNTTTGVSSSTSYNWVFNGGNPNTGNTSGPYEVLYTNAGSYTATLNVNGQNHSIQVIVGNNPGPIAALNLVPGSTGVTVNNFQNTIYFTKCGSNGNISTSGNFQFNDVNQSSYPAGTTQTITWGDGGVTSQSPMPNPVTHLYSGAGIQNMSYTVTYANGCTSTANYGIYIGGQAPGLVVQGAASQSCIPGNYSFSVGGQNVPGTTYTVSFNDGSPDLVYSSWAAIPSTIYHTFNSISCGVTSSVNNQTYPNSYSIQATATNACSPLGTYAGFGPIYVSEGPTPAFTSSPSNVICINNQLTLNNTSISGQNAQTTGCTSDNNFYWEIIPNSGYSLLNNTILGGNNGAIGANYDWTNWTTGSSELKLAFNQPGTYVLKLTVGNNCGPESITDTICVMPAVTSQFSSVALTGCAPLIVNPSNTSSTATCQGYNNNFTWSISNYQNPLNCQNYVPPTFLNGTTPSSSNPSISFTEPGIYNLQLTNELSPPLPGLSCANQTSNVTITVKDVPIVSLPAQAPICETTSFSPTSLINNCYDTTAVNYAWSFGNAAIPQLSNISAPTINYNNSGTYNYSLVATNICGADTATQIITVQPSVNVGIVANGVSCEAGPVTLNGSVTGGSTSGTWSTVPANLGYFSPNNSTLNATYNPPAGTTGQIQIVLTSNPPPAPCPTDTETFTININGQATANAGQDMAICQGQTVPLAGSVGGSASTGTWSSTGNGTFASATSLTTTYTPGSLDIQNGSVNLILTTNDPGLPCSAKTDTLHVTIIPNPTIFENTLDSLVCSNELFNINLSSSITNYPTTYNWSILNSNSIPSSITTTTSGTLLPPANTLSGIINSSQSTPYTLTYQITGTTNGCTSPPLLQQIIINPSPSPSISPNGAITICNGSSITLTASSSNSYLWSSNASTQSINVSTPGTYSVTTTNQYNCTGQSSNVTISVIQPTTPSFNAISSICANGTFALPSTSLNGISGTWSPAINNQTTTSYIFTPSTGQCATTDTMIVTVNALPTPTITANGPTTFCDGSSVILTTSGGTSYSWSQNGSIIAGATASTLTVTTAGSYTVTATNANGCEGTSPVTTIVVNPNPQPVIAASGPTTFCQGQSITLSTTTYDTYLWSNSATSSSISVSTAGTYSVIVTALGCTGQSNSITTSILPLPSAIISGTATVCENAAQPNITFTGSNSSAPYTFTYTINGGANQTITTAGTSSTVTLPVPTSTPGSYVYNVVSVGVGACSNPVTSQNATITVSSNITPTFTQVGPYCNGESIPPLATTSNNSIVGTWAPAINNSATTAAVTTNYTFTPTPGPGICATTATMPIVVNPNTTPLFTQLGPYCQGATPDVLPTTSNNGIAGTWSPATIATTAAGSAVYSFTPTSAAPATCAVPTTMSIVVTTLPSAIISGTATVCENAAQPNITFTGSNSSAPYTFTYTINGGANQTITTAGTSSTVTLPVPTSTPGSYVYNVVSVGVGACSNPVTSQNATITVSSNITPTFTQVGPYCNGESIPPLATTSNNSIVGTWAPAINNSATTAAVTTNYTFTPTPGPGICATTATMPIVVNPNTTPLFTQLGPYCQGATPDVLPTTSNNGIAGTWSPATIATTAAGSAVYSFTPTSAAPATCAVPTTMSIVVTTLPSAIISGTATVCENAAQPNITFTGSNSSAPYTFTYTINGGANQTITTAGTSSTVTLPVPTSTPGSYVYNVVSVGVGACSNPVTSQNATITVSSNITPTFTQVGPYCNGESIPPLATTSNNSIVGTWAPAINNSATTAAVTTNYTFTPTPGPGICATTATMPIVVNPNTTPLFTQLGPYCQGATPDVLPTTSNNGIAGTWSPATIATTAAGSAVYSFTPTSAAPATCAVPTTMSIVVTTLPSAIISGTATVCENAAQPNITFTGSNSSAPYTFTYTINGGANQTITTAGTSSTVTLPVPTSTPGSYVYNVVSVGVGACSNPVTSQNATITVSSNITPTFTQVGPYCNGESIPPLATTSNNSIVGTWAPAINNSATTAAVTTNYTFTPTPGPGICATTATMPIVVNPNTTPLFTQLGPYCQGATPDVLPTTSNNGIAGTWSPATISTVGISGAISTSIYSFTPSITSANAPQCGLTQIMEIIISPLPSATISGSITLCQGVNPPIVTFTGSNSTAPYTFFYHINNGASIVTSSPANSNSSLLYVPTSTPGTFVYSLDSVSVGSCTNSVVNQIATINITETPMVNLNASTTLICPNDPVLLTAIGTPISSNGVFGSYTWSNSSTIISSSQTVNPIQTGPNIYSVTYSLNGCNSQPTSITINVQDAPQITIQNSISTICEGGNVTLTALQTNTIAPNSYIWSTGDTTQSIQVSPDSTTNYSVIGLSGTCESTPANTIVNVVPDPVITLDLMPDTSMCVGGSFTFEINTSGGVGTPTYTWYLNNVPNNTNGAIVQAGLSNLFTTPTIIQPGTNYYYVLIDYPGEGCNISPSQIVQLNTVADPIVTLNPIYNQTLCDGGVAECIIPVVYGGVGNNTYLWLPTMTADSIFCPPSNQIGTQNYNVIVQQSGIGCGSVPSNTVSITVVADPTIQIIGTPNVCEGAEVPLITTVQGGIGSIADYQWSSSYPNGNPYQDISGAVGFNYTTIALDDNIGIAVEMNQTGVGCNASDTFLINVFNDPQVSIIGDSMTCVGLTNNLQAIVTGGVPNSTNNFTWFSPGNEFNPTPSIVQISSPLNQFTGTINSDTSYYVVVDNSGFGCDNDTSALFHIDAIEWAVANFEIDPEIPSQSILNPTFSFVNTSQNSTNYFWDLGECDPQLPLSELYTSPTLSYDPYDTDQLNYTYGCPPGDYAVTLIANNQGMCPSTVTQIIHIQDQIIVYVPNAFTPEDDTPENNLFFPVITGKIKSKTYLFEVYNRWGQQIFVSNEVPILQYDSGKNGFVPVNVNSAWDGYINGDIAQDGVYIWQVQFMGEDEQTVTFEKGHVTLIR